MQCFQPSQLVRKNFSDWDGYFFTKNVKNSVLKYYPYH